MAATYKVSFMGEPGAYSELATFAYFGDNVETIPCDTFELTFSKVTKKEADFAMLPFENSLAGSIHRNYDLMLRHDLHIVGEYNFKVEHCLMALPGVQLEDVKLVHSHPQALAQCENSLFQLGLKAVPSDDTAGSARWLAQEGIRDRAALASRRAADVYGLTILKEGMEDNDENYTRFLALAPEPAQVANPGRKGYKTSIVFSLSNTPGSLFKGLSALALRDINMTKVESRPLPGRPWEYLFYLDFEGHVDLPACTRALEHLKEMAPFLRVLGAYPEHPHRFNWA